MVSAVCTRPLSAAHSTPAPPQWLSSSQRCNPGRPTLTSRLPITWWDRAVTPTRRPRSNRSRMRSAAAVDLPLPGGPCTASTVPARSDPIRRTAAAGVSAARTGRPAGTVRRNSRTPRLSVPASTSRPVAAIAARSTVSGSGPGGPSPRGVAGGFGFATLRWSTPLSASSSCTVPAVAWLSTSLTLSPTRIRVSWGANV